jgi:hypothetical protein
MSAGYARLPMQPAFISHVIDFPNWPSISSAWN